MRRADPGLQRPNLPAAVSGELRISVLRGFWVWSLGFRAFRVLGLGLRVPCGQESFENSSSWRTSWELEGSLDLRPQVLASTEAALMEVPGKVQTAESCFDEFAVMVP